jgi:hypothetical protein
MPYVIRDCGEAWDQVSPPGEYLEYCHHDVGHAGSVGWTKDRGRAMQFATAGEALLFWKQASRSNPTRPDGKPNRPLTAWHVTLEPLP